MTSTVFLFVLIVVVNGFFAVAFFKDLIKHKKEYKNEKGNDFLLAISSPIIFFLSAFGISDFALSTIFYRRKRLLQDKILPGTLNTQCVIPVAVMALAFISVIRVDITTLCICIGAQVIGSYFGSRYAMMVSTSVIRKCMSIGLIMATIFILMNKFHLIPSGGTENALSVTKLIIAVVCLALFGALNNLGIGSYAPTMVTVYALGMNPAVAFPIMMGASTFSIPVGSMQFIRQGAYSRKITFFAATFGLVGVLIGVFLVKKLDVSILQWVIAATLFYTGISMLKQELRSTKKKGIIC